MAKWRRPNWSGWLKAKFWILLLILGRIRKPLENHIPLFWMIWKIFNFLFQRDLRTDLSHYQNNLFFRISVITITTKLQKAESSTMTQPWRWIGIFRRKNLDRKSTRLNS